MAFLDALNDKISKLSQDAIQKTKDMSDSVKISNAIREEENQQNILYQKIGELYYHDCKDAAQGDFLVWCQQITESKNRVAEWKSRLQTIKGVSICPNCHSEVPVNSVFCNNCGAKMPQATVQTEDQTVKSGKICKNCGMPIPEGHVFCTNCGTKVEEEAAEESQEKVLETYSIDLEKQSEVKTCNQCGAVVPEGHLFCTNCGAKLEESVNPEIHEEVAQKVCPNCGKEIKEGQKFCTGCGTKL